MKNTKAATFAVNLFPSRYFSFVCSETCELVNGASRRSILQRWNRYRRDHPKAWGEAGVPVLNQPFGFLNLHLEIREIIYAKMAGREGTLYRMMANGSAIEGGPVDPRLFAINQQVWAEAMCVFCFSGLTFRNSSFASSSSPPHN